MPSLLRFAVCCFLALCSAVAGWAQEYPVKPVRIVVPIAAGGTGDVIARMIGERLTDIFHQQVVIDNRAGANGFIGMDLVAKAPPDGYTLALAGTGTIVINPGLYGRKLPFHPERDFEPVTVAANTWMVLVVHPSLPAKSVRELIALAKAKPGTLDYVSPGNGSTGHLNTALFASMAGIKINPIVYKGSTPGRMAVVAGEVPIYMDGAISALPLIQSGRLRPLGVTSAHRSEILPALPTIGETVPGYVGYVWYGILAPARTPKPIISRLHTAIVSVLKMPEVKARLADQGAEVVGSSPDEFRAYMHSEIAKWTKVIKEVGAKPD